MTIEKKIADNLIKNLNGIDIDIPWVVFSYVSEAGTAMQSRMYDLCMSFIRHWSDRYESKDIRPGMILYPMCVKCNIMIKALAKADADEYNSPRARRLRRQAELAGQPVPEGLRDLDDVVSQSTSAWRRMQAATEANLRRNAE